MKKQMIIVLHDKEVFFDNVRRHYYLWKEADQIHLKIQESLEEEETCEVFRDLNLPVDEIKAFITSVAESNTALVVFHEMLEDFLSR